MTLLSLDSAERVGKAALAYGQEQGMNPLCVAVIDLTGGLKFALRQDGGGLAGVDIAAGKARAALAFGCSSRQIADALAGNPLAGPSVLSVLDGRVVLLGGGVLLHDEEGAVTGAIGVAGGPPDSDEAAAMAGART